ncbi:hypothetical protein lerEdw1_005375 [Lerista edwardsae]|nr:hypothetical protein lerEdw1_005375 [Lerista edwardsae]
MPWLCSGDPFAMFHLYPEIPNQLTGPEEMPLFPQMPEQLAAENYYRDPCSFQFPVPCGNLGRCEYLCGPAFIRKRNERERQRVKCVNEGYAKLRHHLPAEYLEKRLSKVETLRAAIKYIRFLQAVLCSDSEENSKEAHHTSQEDSQIKEEEEITVSFWNGKKAKIPLGVALWIPPWRWQSIVDMIHMPLTTRKKFEGQLHRASYHICPCGPLAAPIYRYTLGGLHRPHCSFACTGPRVFPHMCSLFAPPHISSCCCLKPIDWRQQPSLLELPQGGIKDEEVCSKANTEFLALEGPPIESAAAMPSSPSYSSEPQNGGETCLTKSAMVDHAVNTDPSLFAKPKQQEVKRPDWKYWKRSHPSSSYTRQGVKHFP